MTARTVFIIGAGASKEFGDSMPVGGELAERIQDKLTQEIADSRQGNYGPIFHAIMRQGLGDPEMAALIRIRDGIVTKESIDDFVHEWREMPRLPEIAKLAITQVLLEAERRSIWGGHYEGLMEPAQALRSLRDSWLGFLLRFHNRGFDRRNFTEVTGDIAFVTFNYDRCIETHLFHHLVTGLNVPKRDASALLKTVPIIHVYGMIGELPELGGSQRFGDPDVDYLRHSAAQIRTYTQTVDSIVADQVAHLVRSADRIFFLGSAFHQQNLDILFPSGPPSMLERDGPEIWATTRGLQGRRLASVKGAFEHPVCRRTFEPVSAGELLRTYQDEIFD